MNTHSSAHYFFIGLIALAGIFAVLIFLPYLSSLLLALVLAILFTPLERWISSGKEGSSSAALLTIIIIAIVIITPLFFLTFQLYHEGQTIYVNMTEEGTRAAIINNLDSASTWFSAHFFGIGAGTTFDSFNITDYIQGFFSWVFSNFNILFSSAARIALHLIIMLFALFYLLRDGKKLRHQLVTLSPLIDTYDEKIITKLGQAIHSVVLGTLVVGLIQGICIGIGFYLFGIDNAVLWGSVGIIIALIPGIGTSIMYLPGIIYLFATGSIFAGIGLLVWWIVAVSIIDNYVGPRFMSHGIQIHQFLILLSVLGGIVFFGPIGFIAGPLVVALLFALLDVYKTYRMAIQ